MRSGLRSSVCCSVVSLLKADGARFTVVVLSPKRTVPPPDAVSKAASSTSFKSLSNLDKNK